MPEVTGYTTGSKLPENESLALSCVSCGGLPMANITWLLDGRPLADVMKGSYNVSVSNENDCVISTFFLNDLVDVYDEDVIQCCAHNGLDKEECTGLNIKLDVHGT